MREQRPAVDQLCSDVRRAALSVHDVTVRQAEAVATRTSFELRAEKDAHQTEYGSAFHEDKEENDDTDGDRQDDRHVPSSVTTSQQAYMYAL